MVVIVTMIKKMVMISKVEDVLVAMDILDGKMKKA